MWKKTLLAIAFAAILIFSIWETHALVSTPLSITSYGIIESMDSVSYVVALDGSGDFTDVQDAIDAVPSGSKGIIIIKDGLYDLNPTMMPPFKMITVKSEITLKGTGIDQTIIRTFPTKQPYGSNMRMSSITSQGDIKNLVIENLTVIQNGTPDNMGWSAIDLRGGTNTNTAIRNVKITDVTGAAINIPRFNDVTIENCIIERAWTGIVLNGGSNGLVKGNRIVDTAGDGIFPRPHVSAGLSVTDLTIEDNYIENAGDTGIDITSVSGIPPHERITAQRNVLKNAHIRVAGAQHIKLLGNTIEEGFIGVDTGGAGRPMNITVEGNKVNTSYKVGIGFYGAQDCQALNNEVYMTSPAEGVVQSGIAAGIWGTGLIENNTIVGSANYGINFAGWGMGGGSRITIRENTILDFGDVGIYDDAVNDGPVIVENNLIWDRREPFVSRFGIRTDYEANRWTIRYNRVYAGTVAFISAPSSQVYENIYEPP
jgi:parallel beta-helix repeat protein